MDWTSVDFEKLANAVLLLVIGLLGFLGIGQAKKKSAAAEESMEIAGAVIDRRDVDRLIVVFEQLTTSATALSTVMTNHKKAIDLNTKACHLAATNAKEAADAMEVLTLEIVRKH